MRRSRRSRGFGLVFIAFLALCALCVLSFLPLHAKVLLHTRGHYHFWGHGIAFAVLTFAIMRVARSSRAALVAFLFILLLAWGIEFGQHIVYHEALEQMDVMADWTGALAGSVMSMLLQIPAR